MPTTAIGHSDSDDDGLRRVRDSLRREGLQRALRNRGRQARSGTIAAYVHLGRVGALVELACESDAIARAERFHTLAHEIAMQVAATAPRRLAPEAAPSDDALLCQAFIKDPSRSIADLLDEASSELGESIYIRRFARFELGGDASGDTMI